MNYKILKIQDSSFDELRSLHLSKKELLVLPYDALKEYFLKNRFVYANGFVQYMRSLGNEAEEVFFDIELFQKKWAEENDTPFSNKNWKQEILLSQIKHIKPDVLFLQDINMFSPDVLSNLKTHFPFLKLVVAFLGFYHHFERMRGIDIVLAGIPKIVQRLNEEGVHSILHYHAFDAAILDLLKQTKNQYPEIEFSFFGKSGFLMSGCLIERYWILAELAQRTNIQLWISEDLSRLAAYQKVQFPKQFEPIRPLRERFPEKCHLPVFGIEMYQFIQASKITFNKHGSFALDNAGNMRLFEATGAGTCLLTDNAGNMADLFEPGKEVVTYDSLEDCIEKLNYLLGHDAERRSIAAAGRKRTLKDHTVEQRCRELDTVIRQKLSK